MVATTAHGGRLTLVVAPLDLALVAVRRVLLPVLVIVAGMRTLVFLSGPLEIHASGWFTIGAFVVIGFIYLAVVQTPRIAKLLDAVFSKIRRRVLLACPQSTGAVFHDSTLACRLVPRYLRAPVFRYDQQSDFVKTLTDYIANTSNGGYWIIEGASGAGKTRTAILLAVALACHPTEHTLASRVFFFDLATGQRAETAALRALATPTLDNAIVIVDNFHRVTPETLADLTYRLLDQPGGVTPLLVVLLAQPTDDWRLAHGTELRLLSKAKDNGHHLELEGAPAPHIRPVLNKIDPTFADRILQPGSTADAAFEAQLHLSQVAAANRTDTAVISEIIDVLHRSDSEATQGGLHTLLGVVAALAAFRGAFTRREFWTATASLNQIGEVSRRDRIRLYLGLRRLRRRSLLTWMRAGSSRFVLHESVAQLFVDRLRHNATFLTAFEIVGRHRLHRSVDTADVGWMLAAELNDFDEMRKLFDPAMVSGAYKSMRRTATSLIDRVNPPTDIGLQLVLIHDRVGAFDTARDLVTTVGAPNPITRLGAEVLAAEVAVRHDAASLRHIETLRTSDDHIVAAAGHYWALHLDAHQGAFAPDELGELATDLSQYLNSSDRWGLSVLERAHFDRYRHLYLRGDIAVSDLTDSTDSINRLLRPAVPTYGALTLLYTRAHFCAHALLPALVFQHQLPSQQAATHLGYSQGQLSNREGLLTATADLYRLARDEFWQYGDREARYLQGDIINADLMSADPTTLPTLEDDLEEYRRFISGTGFAYIQALPHLYLARYHALSYFDGLLERSNDFRTPDEHLEMANRHLRSAADFEAGAENRYGQQRAELFRLLLEAVKGPLKGVRVDLSSLQRSAERADYRGLANLAGLAESCQLTSTEVREFLRFTPIVHQ